MLFVLFRFSILLSLSLARIALRYPLRYATYHHMHLSFLYHDQLFTTSARSSFCFVSRPFPFVFSSVSFPPSSCPSSPCSRDRAVEVNEKQHDKTKITLTIDTTKTNHLSPPSQSKPRSTTLLLPLPALAHLRLHTFLLLLLLLPSQPLQTPHQRLRRYSQLLSCKSDFILHRTSLRGGGSWWGVVLLGRRREGGGLSLVCD